MKTLFSGITAILIASLFLKEATAQEQILPLNFNPVIAKNKAVPQASVRNVLSLPFTEDFSYQDIFPDPGKWEDRQAFVNRTFPVDPVSIGVATLDGLNEFGQPYDSISHSFSSIGGADTLTSQQIFMGALKPADSVYFSFFYQPGGLGDDPNTTAFNFSNFGVETGDSLIVEFKDSTEAWQKVWGTDGISFQPFQQVLIRVIDSAFFHDGFQFRFRNYASLIGQYDIWNIDYVKLNSQRTYNDTEITDLAMQHLPTSVLKNYQAMPWNQFANYQATERASEQTASVRNNFNSTKNVNYQMRVTEITTGNTFFTSIPASANFPANSNTILSLPTVTIPSFGLDDAVIATEFTANASGDNNLRNDTAVRYDIFSDYMAYDDGTAEAVFRLQGSPASLALEYRLNDPDSLKGIEILFAHDEVNLDLNLFSIYVWKTLEPEQILLFDDFLLPDYVNEMNGFVYYRLSQPVSVSETFYIGWQQFSLANDLKMDVGFDWNNDASQHLFYNVNDEWLPSQFAGAVMLRPIFGDRVPVGIPEVTSKVDFKIFPNPVCDVLYVKGESGDLHLEVMDYTGKILLSHMHQSSIALQHLPDGMFLLRITNLRSGKSSVEKFVKAH